MMWHMFVSKSFILKWNSYHAPLAKFWSLTASLEVLYPFSLCLYNTSSTWNIVVSFTENYTLLWFCCMKNCPLNKVMKRQEAKGAHLSEPQKAHPMHHCVCLLWRKMVTVYCFVWSLGLWLWSVSEWVCK